MATHHQVSNSTRKNLLVINCIILAIGSAGGPLILRVYFVKGGQSIWLSSWLQSVGLPILFIPPIFAYFHRRHRRPPENAVNTSTKFILMDSRMLAGATVVGVMAGADNYFFGYGTGRLPTSTSNIISASQLSFTAVFAFLIVKQKFNPYLVNAVVLLTAGPVVLSLRADSDRPPGESNKLYVLGFVMTVLAAALYGLMMPIVELMYNKAKQAVTYALVLEIQLVISFVATLFCTIGMLIFDDFKVIPREARQFELGETQYYMVLFWNAIIWQFYFLGSTGVVFCASSLVSGIVIAICIPVTEILAEIFFHEKFQAEKGVALFLSLWGFVSYFYGEIKQNGSHESQLEEIITIPNDAP